MAKKHGNASVCPADLEARARKAYEEGRSQHALDLAKQAYKQEAIPSRKLLLSQTYLLRAKQLRLQGLLKEAAALLEHATLFGGDDPDWLQNMAEELAASGNLRAAQDLLARLPASPSGSRTLARAADAAILQGPTGRAQLPANLQETYDLVVTAFAQLESGQDELARTTLQGIGLQSPFLEWKLLLRGLLAYYQKDDARALENWQRLDLACVPARMIAPIRFLIDPAFGQQQTSSVQASLQQMGDRLLGRDLATSLKQIRTNMGSSENLPKAFRQAAQLVPALKQVGADVVARLATCFYWAILSHGEADDMQRLSQTFGPSADDPHFDRLEALVYEKIGDLTRAHKHWNKYQRWLESTGPTGNSPLWCGANPEHLGRARALIWCRMGENAASLPDKLPPMLAFFQEHPAFPKKLSPGAEECFTKALKLVPDLLEAHVALFEWCGDNGHQERAVQVGRDLLLRHPDHAQTLESLGDLHNRRGEYDEASDLYARAYRLNPLERSLRDKLRMVHVSKGRRFAEGGAIEPARSEFQTALGFGEPASLVIVHCKWAAAELCAGDKAQAEEHLQQARAESKHPLPVAYYMVTEVARYKLKGATKTRFDNEFKAALSSAPSPPAIATALSMADALSATQVSYSGQQAHEKKLLAYLRSVPPQDFSEDLLVEIVRSLVALQAAKPLRELAAFGERRFPRSPWFPFLQAEFHLARGPDGCPTWTALALLEKAERLAHALPPSASKQKLVESIEMRKEMLRALSPDLLGALAKGFEEMLGEFGGDESEDAEYEDDGDFFVPAPSRRRPKKQRKGR